MTSNFDNILQGMFPVIAIIVCLFSFRSFLNDEARIESNDVTFHFSNLKIVVIALPCAVYASVFTLLAKSGAKAELDLDLLYRLLAHAVMFYGLAAASLVLIGRIDNEAYWLALWITSQFCYLFAFCVFATIVVAAGLAELATGA